MKEDESGYIVVETVGTFVPFVLLVVSILSLVNIISLQARIHNALTQTANSLSMYCYVLKVTGIADGLMTLDGQASVAGETITSVLTGIESLSKGSLSDASEGIRVLSSVEIDVGDPKGIAQSLANYGINELRNHVSASLIEPMVMRYLATDEMTSEEYLRRARVVNFELTECVVIDQNGNIRITAEYEIEYTFGALRLPFGPTLRVTQTVVTKAWLGGSGEGYRR